MAENENLASILVKSGLISIFINSPIGYFSKFANEIACDILVLNTIAFRECPTISGVALMFTLFTLFALNNLLICLLLFQADMEKNPGNCRVEPRISEKSPQNRIDLAPPGVLEEELGGSRYEDFKFLPPRGFGNQDRIVLPLVAKTGVITVAHYKILL